MNAMINSQPILLEQRYEDNISRVRNLLSLYRDQLAGPGQGRRAVHSTDVLRAATVFLHATLESFLRDLARWKLPGAPEEVLNDIPLIGLGTKGRAEKFFLGKLASYKEKSVEDLLRLSITKYLDTTSFNDTTEIAKLLESISINVEHVNSRFNDISEMIKRRHHIVHQADRNERPGSGQHKARGINTSNIERWIEAVDEFVQSVLDRL